MCTTEAELRGILNEWAAPAHTLLAADWPTGLCGLTDCQGEGNEGNEGNVVNRDVGQD